MGFEVGRVDHQPARLTTRVRQLGEDLVEHAKRAPAQQPIVDGLVRTVFFGAILPAATNLQNMHDPAQNAVIILASGAGLVNRQVRNDFRPLRITEPKQVRIHGSGSNKLRSH